MGACQRDVVSALCRKSFRWIVLLLWLTSAARATWRTGLYKYSAGTQLNRESSASSQTSIYQKRYGYMHDHLLLFIFKCRVLEANYNISWKC